MEIEYRKNDSVTPNELKAVFLASGIRRPTEDLPRLKKMLDHANLIITARKGKELVGIARALTDFSYCCYLSDLAVVKNYQSMGIGKRLIMEVKEAISSQSMLLLLSAPEAMEYYEKIGFSRVDNGWIIKRVS